MPAGHGVRSRTRDTFSRPFRGKGYINLTTYLRTFKLGDYVDVKVNGAVHKVSRPSPPHPSPPLPQVGPATLPGPARPSNIPRLPAGKGRSSHRAMHSAKGSSGCPTLHSHGLCIRTQTHPPEQQHA